VHGGLSRFDRAAVAECNRLGILIDCAHASFDTTMAVLEASAEPVIISHGQLPHPGATHPRLLTSAHVAEVASADGLIGAWPAGPWPISAPRSSGSPK
jgi:membrane dipeptidase